MTRALIDQDITPTDHLTDLLPDSWDVAVGLPSEEASARVALEDADVVFVTSRVPLSSEVIGEATELQVVGKLGTGLDSIDLEAARDAGIEVTYTPGHNALAVAEHTLCLTLATARRLTEARRLMESDRWRDAYTHGTELSGSTVGIVGFGNVGKRVGTLLSGFDVNVLVHDPYVPDIDAELVGGSQVALDGLLERSDFVLVTAELTEETRGLLGERELSLMKSDALLVNTARGPIVDEASLVDALRSGSIGGAGLDVFETEPLPSASRLLEFDQVVVTPHVSAVTMESRTDGIERLAENVQRVLDGAELPAQYDARAD